MYDISHPEMRSNDQIHNLFSLLEEVHSQKYFPLFIVTKKKHNTTERGGRGGRED